jgi:hypothetical protein
MPSFEKTSIFQTGSVGSGQGASYDRSNPVLRVGLERNEEDCFGNTFPTCGGSCRRKVSFSACNLLRSHCQLKRGDYRVISYYHNKGTPLEETKRPSISAIHHTNRKEKNMNDGRRHLLKMFAATAGTAALTPFLARNLHAAKEPEKIPEVPWTYKKLDPVAVAERAYPGYFKGGCAYGAFEGIIGELKKVTPLS